MPSDEQLTDLAVFCTALLTNICIRIHVATLLIVESVTSLEIEEEYFVNILKNANCHFSPVKFFCGDVNGPLNTISHTTCG